MLATRCYPRFISLTHYHSLSLTITHYHSLTITHYPRFITSTGLRGILDLGFILIWVLQRDMRDVTSGMPVRAFFSGLAVMPCSLARVVVLGGWGGLGVQAKEDKISKLSTYQQYVANRSRGNMGASPTGDLFDKIFSERVEVYSKVEFKTHSVRHSAAHLDVITFFLKISRTPPPTRHVTSCD